MALTKLIDSLYGELSLASTDGDAGISPDVLKTKSLSTRLRIHMARTAVAMCPNVVENLLNYPYKKNGLEVIGYGFQSTVLRMDNKVLKVMRRSISKDDSWRNSILDNLKLRQDVAINYMEDYVVPQEFTIESHPVFEKRKAIIARQPFLHHNSINLSDLPETPSHDIENRQLQQFAITALNMFSTQQLVPDVIGANNIVAQEGRLALLDSVPMTRSDNPEGFDKTVKLLRVLASESDKATG